MITLKWDTTIRFKNREDLHEFLQNMHAKGAIPEKICERIPYVSEIGLREITENRSILSSWRVDAERRDPSVY